MGEGLDIESLYREFHKDVYHFSFYFSSNKQDAEDITQETFIKAIRNQHTLRDQARAKYWLLSIARHTAIDHLRKKKLRSTFPALIEKISSQDRKDSLDAYLLEKEHWQDIQDALLKIKPHYRGVLILRGIQEMTIKETAEILTCSELKVRVDFHRAVKVLKKELGRLEGVDQGETD
ncbi:RNA polymerase sigma-70 factor (ECF subfamily) [Cytobacillus eiseniae]|uniref:RNA polymerase sigma-70 factor (ECF subfamily) n=1 Tax=Cytobacillus eiseniae TaxID=762947 RepID=A0ABS4RI59_9BACI|nr:RNA polymerase sigma factor [Cytobacillus eiseniae]MBP2242025.1 RNA polymerase sigma-70 factor (ECF subfamily) [Cytobacillus eiseniae]